MVNETLVAELLAEDPFFETVTGIEQHPHRDRLVRNHRDAAHVTGLVVIGDGGHGALVAFQNFDDDERSIRQQGPAPAAVAGSRRRKASSRLTELVILLKSERITD